MAIPYPESWPGFRIELRFIASGWGWGGQGSEAGPSRFPAVSPGLVGVTGGGQGGAKGPRPDPLGFPPFRPGWAGVGWGGEVPSVCHRSPHAANPPPAAHRHLNRPPPQRSVRPTGLVRQLQAHTWCQLAPHPSTYTGRSSARFKPRQNKFSQICANLRKFT